MAVIKATDTDFKAVLSSNQKVVVKYYADWCGNCRLFSPKYKRLSDDEAFTDVAFVDVNAETSPEARKLASVTNLPFFAIFQNGELVDTVAASKEEAVRDLISKLNQN
ncbi:thioredoxin family protein [Pontibacter akesuensis]|uniref:Thioredoxin n=1 Tax=Pontibacter akesuensis TaxID=388950 RepID=A0A1I7I447_9BACT|nr:thioredoxin family protein [Pontibacter akesuensis]GHA65122.1 thiol reductase thioredoxin [Pontibacter akesuensis]SFU67698.1 Thioredoxin [Pontibacter akesuensis]